MRDFIGACSRLFVAIGVFIILIGAFLFVTAIGDGLFGSGLLIAGAAVLAGASVTLVGGGTALLASIDERLEDFMKAKSSTNGNSNNNAEPVTPLLPPAGQEAPAGRYRTLDHREVTHEGGPVPAHMHPKDTSVVL